METENQNPYTSQDNVGEEAVLDRRNSLGPFAIAMNGIWATLTLSMRRMIRSKFLWVNLFLASIPIVIVTLWAVTGYRGLDSIELAHIRYEMMLRTLYFHFIVFFVANIFGFAVMRQEFDDQTLHYLLLQPVPRWTLVAGKLAACLVLASAICIFSFWITYFIMTLPKFGLRAVVADLFGAGRALILLKESLVIILALLAYTTIGMLMGSFFKSSLYTILLLAWESGLPYLPGTLKFWTVMHYLQSLLPVRLTEQKKLFELLGEPATPALSLGVIFGASLGFAIFCSLLFQFRECLYKEA